jgi:hypothetical protein
MAWTYSIPTGAFLDPEGEVRGKGYSGQPPHVNDVLAQSLHDVGPIVEGLWQGVELIPESTKHGPYVIRLEPYPQTDTLGRSGFMLHGDSIARPGFASEGCIIQSRDVREMFWASLDHDILVTKEIPS